MIGIGIGIVLATSMMLLYKLDRTPTKAEIEEKARSYGMHYSDEDKVFFNKDVNKK
ncbi:hypothetical protein [Inconstantimicrobium mannanitabidum]|uniref:Uncharacterized protein n=1 Tax=Inconstantimicrobium mannanitabidum TaxID=1604901 RepID=A0ACB5R911_9CLOT|nr:hypothetical protein [Clostridium sp. TW13]GKX65509.1 hypothetical protein rsdtw13_07670 [Clostridium sp. TW13]